MKKYILPVLLVIVTLIISIVGLFGFRIMFMLNGLKYKNTYYYEHTADRIGGETISVFQTEKKEKAVLVIAVRKGMFWKIEELNYFDGKEKIQAAWVKSKGISRFSMTENPEFITEIHYVFYGNDANSKISLNYDNIPQNVLVNLKQLGNEYWIEVTTEKTESFSIDDYITRQ